MIKTIITSLIVSAITVTAGLWYYDTHYATKIGVVDLTGYIQQLKKEYMAGKLPRDELERRLKRVSERIKNAHSPHTILILKEVVVDGRVQDITSELPGAGSHSE